MRLSLQYLFIFLLLPFLAQAEYVKGKRGSIGLAVGLPQLISADITARHFEPLHISTNIGFYPVNSMLQEKISYDDVDLGSLFFMRPDAEYSASSFGITAKLLVSNSGWFVFGQWTRITLTADITADLFLKSPETQLTEGLISGEITAKQNMLGGGIGKEWRLGTNGFFQAAFGVTKPSYADVEANLSEKTSLFASFGGLDSELEEGLSDLEAEIEEEIEKFRQSTKIYPILFISIGVTF